MIKSKAFTLAEVLITLVIIGVIAAMTIPTLMGSTNDQEIKSRYKKAFSSINQALALEHSLYGNIVYANGWHTGNQYSLASMLKNHLSIIKEDTDDNENYCLTSADGMIYEFYGDGIGINMRTDTKPMRNSWDCQSDIDNIDKCKPNTFSLTFHCGKDPGYSICANDVVAYAYLYDISNSEALNKFGGFQIPY